MKDMENTSRRMFMISVAAGASALASGAMAQAPAPMPMLSEGDSQAAALGYVADTAKADAKKYPKHASEQKCSACQLFAGKPNEAGGACPLFAGKQVAASGWCSAYIKKAG